MKNFKLFRTLFFKKFIQLQDLKFCRAKIAVHFEGCTYTEWASKMLRVIMKMHERRINLVEMHKRG